ncbi:hypothetical protein [Pantoea ananatis]|uniref:hypothetical protein n=1 Tax=Pantoea ananas TaxID=553 RepID=UPI000E288B83|nr:hypothetical protein [Pantoea ananatis]REE77876.1 hypothetical protein C7424_0897 [Pantoea ananatis]BBL31193.1 hypothetical protein PAFU01_26410 [Pantoea ananatis]
MDFGVALSDNSGNPFYIKGTMPLTLMGKQTFSIPSGGLGSAVVHENDNVLRLFYYDASGGDGYAFYSRDTQNRGVLTYGGNNRACVITLYTFGYQYQNPPKFGIGIFDNASPRRCIIHNQSKVLSNVQNLGTEGDENAGYKISVNLSGRWAISPVMTGVITGVINQGGQAYPFQSVFYARSLYDGSNSAIASILDKGVPTGGVSNVTYSNFRNRIFAVDMSRY